MGEAMAVTSEAETPAVGRSTPGSSWWLDWRRLVTVSGIVGAVVTGVAAALLSDVEGGLVAVIFAVSTWLFASGRHRLGVTGLILVSGVTLFFMGTAAATNIAGWAGPRGTLIALGLSAASALVLIACVGWLIRRGSTSSVGPWLAVGVVAAGSVIPLVAGVLGNQPQRESAGIELVAENVAFDQSELRAAAGEVTVSLENKDLFWHTFTVEDLGVDLRVPVAAQMTVTFDAPAGEYTFICAIPGHPEAGMEGTLIVEG